MDLPTFVKKWNRAELSEQAASQTHFNDLCALLGVRNPIEADPVGDTFTFEKAVAVSGAASLGAKGERGRADVWYRGKFVWEYKRKGKYADLADAYRQGNAPRLLHDNVGEGGRGGVLSAVLLRAARRGTVYSAAFVFCLGAPVALEILVYDQR